jgi:hypothetical protein
MPRRRTSFYLLPGLSIAAAALGLVWGWIGVTAAIGGGGPIAYLFVLFGFGGIALGIALWRAWRTFVNQAK